MVSGPLVYVVRANFEEGFEHEHHDWYMRRHAPDVLGVGFWSARAYYATDRNPLMWNHYEIESTAIFHNPIYNSMHANDPDLPTVVSKLIGRSVSVYSQIEVVNGSGDIVVKAPTFSGPTVSCMRFDSDDSAVGTWFRNMLLTRMRKENGVRYVRLMEQREQHPKWPTTEPRWYVTVESALTLSEPEMAARQLALEEAAAALPGGSSSPQVNTLTKQYALVREDLFD